MYKWLSGWKWYADWCSPTRSYYACRSATVSERVEGYPKTTRMHRQIMEVTNPKIQVDHLHHETLDNRVSQLELVTNRKNKRNLKKGSTSRYPNVCWNKHYFKWWVHFSLRNTNVYMGRFTDEDEAGMLAETVQKYLDTHPDCTVRDLKNLRFRIRKGYCT